MKRYQINVLEYDYIKDMLTYLDTTENQMSNEGRKDMKDVLGRIKSRPVLDIIIGKELNVHTDPTEEQNKSDNIMTEVNNTEATVEDYLAFIKAGDETGSVAYLEAFFDESEEGQANMRKFVETVMESAANEVVEEGAQMAPAEAPEAQAAEGSVSPAGVSAE